MNHQTWLRTAGMISAAAMALTLTACGGSDDGDGVSTEPPPPTSAPTAVEETPEPTGTITVSGEEELEGDLGEIVCVPSDEGTQVTADISEAGMGGRLTIVTGEAPAGRERRDSLSVDGGGKTIYNRFEADSLPHDIVEDGTRVTGSVILADLRDVGEPDVDKRKQVTVTVDVDCGS